ncbi:Na(+)/H(+) exchange regulatory cofactor NHE-RF1-like [Teleopsis dalmanni]|uniref:Na(+)/H(+) exchange regulatory cofactor NHE-RF1-like n=1 Tax=Teleopsis dalmanni TaxID=139649 RepID=UPI0018CD0D18|nr:Na(+)/H(+) exchange regulatory cofactor NHE-RF1-like [Teleopsis dalmanni]XP_037948144.1 Na(+)/H(+) exchange regulatory cofactor NHE-RF1-like [Teleopsis dalmanni]XP_037948145.1 Na(+)/H(+) exchange regulatory cofactor NHE-RF1-like [Teleopsis dalmanni]XP_037949202.1 Na(+)/H(+) exchange regulatory cofactor NHE-RF1-like [Teleopsis dalmanni]
MSEDQMHYIPESTSVSKRKMCHIVKRDDFDGYGFNLHSEKIKPGQYIGKVDKNSPAESAGLREGDQIIEVNGVTIGNESHKQVVQRIKSIANEVRLLLLDVDRNNLTKHHPIPFSSISNDSESVDIKINNNENIFDDALQFNSGSNPNINSKSSIIDRTAQNECENSSNNVYSDDHDDYKAGEAIPYSANNFVNEKTVSDRDHQLNIAQERNRKCTLTEGGNSNTTSNSANLELPMTAAEMRAKLFAKKKYNPKTDIVDIRKKFEIIQKL